MTAAVSRWPTRRNRFVSYLFVTAALAIITSVDLMIASAGRMRPVQ